MNWLWRKWHSTIGCVLGFHRGCDGLGTRKDDLPPVLCTCRCHYDPSIGDDIGTTGGSAASLNPCFEAVSGAVPPTESEAG